MIVGGQTEEHASTIIVYHGPFDLGFTLTVLHATQVYREVQGEVKIHPVILRFKV